MRPYIFVLLLVLSPLLPSPSLAQSTPGLDSLGTEAKLENDTATARQTPTKTPTALLEEPVLVLEIASEVDLGMASYVEKAIQRAEHDHAAILLHINTFGGRIDAASRIRDAVLHAKVPMTIAFIDPKAISAGAFIALAAKKIVMADGATFGAATPVDGEGVKASEKVNSFMRAEMRATAEANHRDGRIAEAMVDETEGLDSVNGVALAHGKLLTLTSENAPKVGYCDGRASTIEEALTIAGITSKKIDTAEEGFGDKLVRFLTSGIVSSLLIMFGIGGLFYSLKTGHFGAITIVGIVCLFLFFGGQYITSVAPFIAIIVFLAGITMLLVEISPVPTFGMAGILGVIWIWVGLFLALAGPMKTLTPSRLNETLWTLASSLVGVIVIASLIIKYAPKSTWMRKFQNQSTSGDTSTFILDNNWMLGKLGIAHTMLRPAGTAMIDGKKFDVMTRGEFIQPGTEIIVASVANSKTIVKAAQGQEGEQPVLAGRGDTFGGKL